MPGIGMGIGLWRSSGSQVTPRTIGGSDLALWYHYDDRVDVAGVTSQWTDLSGNGLHATQSSAGDRPVPDPTAFGGRGGLRFSAGAEWLETPVITFGVPTITTFMVMKSDIIAATAPSIYAESSTNVVSMAGPNFAILHQAFGGINGDDSYIASSGNYVSRGKTTANSTSNRSLIHTFDTTLVGGAQIAVFENGSTLTTTAIVSGAEQAGNFAANKIYIGARATGIAPLRGVIREFGIIKRALTQAEINALYAYQRSDSGL